MSDRHTPGPWVLSTPYTDDFPTMTLGHGEERGDRFVEEALGEVWGLNISEEEFRANAELIASAPTLQSRIRELEEALAVALPVVQEAYEAWTSYTTRDDLLEDGTVDIEDIDERSAYRDCCRDRDALAAIRTALGPDFRRAARVLEGK